MLKQSYIKIQIRENIYQCYHGYFVCQIYANIMVRWKIVHCETEQNSVYLNPNLFRVQFS